MDAHSSPQHTPLTPDEPSHQPHVQPIDSMADPMVEPDTVAVSVKDEDTRLAVPATTRPAAFDDSTIDSLDADTARFTTEPTVSVATEPATQAAIEVPAALAAAPVGSVFGTGPTAPQPKAPNKGLRAMIIAAAFVVLGGGSALAYNLYYQNEQKVVTDSIVTMMQAKTAEFTASMIMQGESGTGMDISVEMNGASSGDASQVDARISAKMDGKTYSVTAAGVIDDKSNLYFKVGDITKVVDELKVLLPADSQGAIDDIVAKVDNKWIKVGVSDMKDVSESASKTQACMTDAVKKFQDDKVATKQVGDLYRKNKFIVIDEKLGSKDGSLGYVLSGDKEAAKAFALSLKDTDLYKDLNKCDDSFTINEKTFETDSVADTADTRIELWVDRWSHQITKLSVTSKAIDAKTTTTMIVEPVFNTPVTIQTPKDTTTIKQLQKDIEALSETYSASLYDPSYGYDGVES